MCGTEEINKESTLACGLLNQRPKANDFFLCKPGTAGTTGTSEHNQEGVQEFVRWRALAVSSNLIKSQAAGRVSRLRCQQHLHFWANVHFPQASPGLLIPLKIPLKTRVHSQCPRLMTARRRPSTARLIRLIYYRTTCVGCGVWIHSTRARGGKGGKGGAGPCTTPGPPAPHSSSTYEVWWFQQQPGVVHVH